MWERVTRFPRFFMYFTVALFFHCLGWGVTSTNYVNQKVAHDTDSVYQTMRKLSLFLWAFVCLLSPQTKAQTVSQIITLTVSGTTNLDLTDKADEYVVRVCDDGGLYGKYSNGCRSSLLITLNAGDKLILFGELNTEKNSDYLRIYDGSTTSSTQLASWTGSSQTVSYTATSSGTKMLIYFYSDNSGISSGFDVTVKYEKALPTYTVPSSGARTLDLTNVDDGYQFRIVDHSGMSGSYSNNCSGNLLVTLYAGDTLKLSGSLSTENYYDYLSLYDGNSTSGTFLQEWTGSSQTVSYTATGLSTNMLFYFHSDNSNTDAGFNITATYQRRFKVIDGDFAYTDSTKTNLLKYLGNSSNVVVPSSVTTIGDNAFANCDSLKSITIPSSVTSVGGLAFSGCDSLVSVTIESNADFSNALMYFSNGNFRYQVIDKDKVYVVSSGNSYSGNLVIPASVTVGNTFSVTGIGTYAFSTRRGLTSVTIPDGVTVIGERAFIGCDSLTSITIPNSVTDIEYCAFAICYKLKNLTIPNSVINIGKEAFGSCRSLKTITVPASVTSIGERAFADCDSLETVIIEGSANIGERAFEHDTSITSVTLSRSVTSIGRSAFYDSRKLTTIIIPQSVQTIGYNAFDNSDMTFYCERISEPSSWRESVYNSSTRRYETAYWNNQKGTVNWGLSFADSDFTYLFDSDSTATVKSYLGSAASVTIPDSVTVGGVKYEITDLADNLFKDNTTLTSVTIPSSVTNIGFGVFSGCTNLQLNEYDNAYYLPNNGNQYYCLVRAKDGITSCTINSNCKIISGEAFRYSGLTSISIPNSVVGISQSAFKNCYSMTSATIGNGVKRIGNNAFGYCQNLATINIPNSVTSIGQYAFQICIALTSINIPNKITRIEDGTFNQCLKLTNVTIPNSVKSIGQRAFYNCDGFTIVTIPNSVTSIGAEAFSRCKGLTTITIPNSVTSIGTHAFDECQGLESVTLGSGITSISDYLFALCYSLKSVTIPESVTSIEQYAFRGCNSLTSLTIPNSVTSIGQYAFAYCTALKTVDIPDAVTSIGSSAFYNVKNIQYTGNAAGRPWDALSVNGIVDGDYVYGNDIKTQILQYIGDGGNVTIPNSATIIDVNAFKGNNRIKSVTMGSNVQQINSGAFQDCDSLTSVTIGSSVWGIGDNAFYDCDRLSSVIIPNSVVYLGTQVFYDCDSLKSVNIGNGLTSIDNSVFYSCDKLEQVSIGTMLRSISDNAFSNCNNLKYNEYGNAKYLGNAENPYMLLVNAKSSGITSCTINANCNYINQSAFYNCDSLTTINIPHSVTTIGEKAFYSCDGLRDVNIPNSVSIINSQAFNNRNIFFYCEASSKPSGWYTYSSYNSSNWDSSLGTCCWGASFGKDCLAYYITGQDSVDVVKYMNNDTAIVIPSTVTYSGTTYKVTGIKELAFEDCNNLKTITIPNTVARIAALAFVEANKLETINVDAANANYTSVDGVLFNKDKTTLVCYPASNNKNVDYTIPSTVTTIVSGAFYKCNTLNSIYIPYNVTNVGYYAISAKSIYCEHWGTPDGWSNYWKYSGERYRNARRIGDLIYTITEVDDDEFVAKLRAYTGDGGNVMIPTQITVREVAYEETDDDVIDVSTENKATYPVVSIESEVFRNCEGLTSVSIGESVTEINSSAFSNCTGLTSAYIGSSVKSISGYAFYNCSSLKTVTIPASVTFINTNAFNKCDSITTLVTNSNAIGSVFSNKSLLTTVSIGDSVTTIPDNAFKNCTALSSISIPNSVKSIGESAFENCIELSSITIPKGVTSIGASAFKDCINLEIYCQAKVKYSGWDDDWNISECPVHMGANLFVVKATSNNAEWGTVTGSGNYMAGNEVRLMATASAGYRFVKWSDNNTDNPRVEIVDSDLTLSAVFEKVASATKFTVVGIANNAAFGSVTGTATYNYGDTATLVATANAGYRFVKWNDDNIANPRKVVVTDHLNLTAIFEVDNSTPASFMIVVVANNAAYGTTTGTAVYDAGAEATISAVAAAGCYFAKWSDGNSDNPRRITVSSDLTITAIFAKDGEKPEDPGTAVEDEVAVAVNIYAYRNTIVVENADAEILVYNAMGRLVATSSDENAEIRVNGSGVYIVKVGNSAKRVMINE